jgi:hypothetical protein
VAVTLRPPVLRCDVRGALLRGGGAAGGRCVLLRQLPRDKGPFQPIPNYLRDAPLAVHVGEQWTLSWVDLPDMTGLGWLVDWSVRPQGRGTRLLLRHSGFDIGEGRQKMARNGMERMWQRLLTSLDEMLDRRRQ